MPAGAACRPEARGRPFPARNIGITRRGLVPRCPSTGPSGAMSSRDDCSVGSGRSHNIDDKGVVALLAGRRQSPRATTPFDESKLQEAAKVDRVELLPDTEADLAERRFFVWAKCCEHSSHDGSPSARPEPSKGTPPKAKRPIFEFFLWAFVAYFVPFRFC